MTEKRMLADVLWEAANEHLCVDGSCDDGKEKFSCYAALGATKESLAYAFDRCNDSETISFLRELGCEEIQGFYIAKPLDANAIESWWRMQLGNVGVMTL